MVDGVRRRHRAAMLLASSLSVLSVSGTPVTAQEVLSSLTGGSDNPAETIAELPVPEDLTQSNPVAELPTAEQLRGDRQSSHLLSQAAESGRSSGGRDQSPTDDRVTIGVGDSDAPWAFSFGFGSKLGIPNALEGGTRRRTASPAGQRAVVFPISGFVEQGLGSGRRLLLEVVGDPQNFGADLSFSFLPTSLPGQFSLNVQNQSSRAGAFENGRTDVDLPGGADPWVNRLGGGFEYFQALNGIVDIAGGINYQAVSVRKGMFTSSVSSVDELGNPVTVGSDGIDPLLTLNVATVISALDDRSFPTRGTRFQIGLDQSIPVGEANITMSRLSANWSQFIPLNGVVEQQRAHTLILNLQGGTILGDAPPYAAFSLGDAFTVRGFKSGEIGTGRSYVSSTAEYRYPIGAVAVFGKDVSFRGSVFVDYGSVLDSQGAVIGRPGQVREKYGDGFGFGIGFLARSPLGLFRLEPTFNGRGDFVLSFQASDRF